MESINEEVWQILNEEEKISLSLSLSYGKSTWEAGEIMKKAHYKYLEINARAKKFLKMFTEFHDEHNRILPDKTIAYDFDIPWDFIIYIKCVMIRRMKAKEAYGEVVTYGYHETTKREYRIKAAINNLKNSNNPYLVDLFDLIIEFDRWNNFRILPKDLQEPSAFKRRNKSRDSKHLKNITNLTPYAIDRIISNYSYKGKYKKLYTGIISETFDDNYELVQFKDAPKEVKEITKIGLFIFEDKETTEEFCQLVSDFLNKDSRSCKDGQRFWPKFRILMGKAVNYKTLNNISPSRKYFEDAFRDLDILKEKKALNKVRKKRKQFHGEKKSDESSHWS